MRVIAGRYKGTQIPQPKNTTIRPTTDRAKEGLFNILSNRLDFEQCTALDLFSGSGNISIELSSRGCKSVVAVEQSAVTVSQVREFIQGRKLDRITCIQRDVFGFLRQHDGTYDLVFADPPYNSDRFFDLPDLVIENQILKPNGLLIIEHPSQIVFHHPHWQESRNYGQTVFSFFSN